MPRNFFNIENGRLIDVGVMSGVKPIGDAPIGLRFSNSAVTGVQKASQFFVTFLLTQQGSILHDPNFGSVFAIQFARQSINNGDDLQTYFSASVAQMLGYIQAFFSDRPSDERIAEVTLDSYEFDIPNETIKMHATVTTEAGSTADVYLPLTQIAVT